MFFTEGVPTPPTPPPMGGPAIPTPAQASSGPPRPPSKDAKPTSSLPAVSNERGNLLASIRAGITLKTVDESTSSMPDGGGGGEEDGLDGMAGALARALQQRSNVIQQSGESLSLFIVTSNCM